MMNKSTHKILSLAVLALALGSAQAGTISIVNQTWFRDAVNQTTYSTTFDAGGVDDVSNMLIVSVVSEVAGTVTSLTYGGVSLLPNLITNTNSGRNLGIYTLSNPNATGSNTLEITTSGTAAAMFLGIVSIKSSDGNAIAVGASGSASGASAPPGISLNVPFNDSFVYAAFSGNQGNNSAAIITTPNPNPNGIVPLDGRNNPTSNLNDASMSAAMGWDLDVASGTLTVVATIASDEAAGGKLFGRLLGAQ